MIWNIKMQTNLIACKDFRDLLYSLIQRDGTHEWWMRLGRRWSPKSGSCRTTRSFIIAMKKYSSFRKIQTKKAPRHTSKNSTNLKDRSYKDTNLNSTRTIAPNLQRKYSTGFLASRGKKASPLNTPLHSSAQLHRLTLPFFSLAF